MYWLGEPLLYVCLAVITGWVVMLKADNSMQYDWISKQFLIAAVVGVAIFSFLPLIRIIMFFAEDLGFGLTVKSVLFSFSEGKAYWWTLIFSVLFIVYLGLTKPAKLGHSWFISVLLLYGLIGSIAWSSHTSSLLGFIGFFTQYLHFIAVSVWAGTLFVAGWFKPATSSWRSFLTWFHPMAILCMALIITSGFVLTFTVSPEYVNAWMLPYGQALLIKHLLFIPLLVFAVINGFLIKRKIKRDVNFNPRPWARAESMLILIIFIVTGFMNQQPAPHHVAETLTESPASKLFLWFHAGQITKENNLQLHFDPIVIILMGISLLSLFLIFITFRRKNKAIHAFWLSLIFVFVCYVGLMTAVS